MGVLILRQKSFWFGIPGLKTPQPILPYCSINCPSVTARPHSPRFSGLPPSLLQYFTRLIWGGLKSGAKGTTDTKQKKLFPWLVSLNRILQTFLNRCHNMFWFCWKSFIYNFQLKYHWLNDIIEIISKEIKRYYSLFFIRIS